MGDKTKTDEENEIMHDDKKDNIWSIQVVDCSDVHIPRR